MPLRLPQIPDYELLQQLHCGGQGIIFRGVQTVSGQPVAVKLIRPEMVVDERAIARFEMEGRAAARLNHPNIVKLYKMGCIDGVHYLVMELIDGPDLSTLVKSDGRMPVRSACEYVRQVALGLQHAADHGLIHRDMKPSNLVRASDGTVKILDLGLARWQQDTETHASLTSTGALIGTADFIAPEQIISPSQVDIRADLYSLGCTLYFLLAGSVPFPNMGLMAKLDAHRWQWPIPLEQLRADVPLAVSSVCRQLLAKDPQDRFATPLDLANMLATILASPAAEIGHISPVSSRWEAPKKVSEVEAKFPPGFVGEVHCLRGHSQYVTALALDEKGILGLSGDLSGELRVWDLTNGNLGHVLMGHQKGIWSVRVKDSRFAWSASGDRSIRTWDLEEGSSVATITLSPGVPTDNAVLSPNLRQALLCSSDGHLYLYDLDTQNLVSSFSMESQEVGDFFHFAAFSADAKYLSCGDRDGNVRLWDLASGEPLLRIAAHDGPVYAIDFSSDGRWLATGGYDRSIRLWDRQTGTEVGVFFGHRAHVRAIRLTNDSRRLLSGSNDRTIRLWDIETGKELCCLQGHTDHVTSLAVSPDGRRAISGSNDRTVRLWHLPSANQPN